MTQPALSAIVATHDRHSLLDAAIQSLLAQSVGASLEILVIDNSPDQASAARFGERYRAEPRIRYVLETIPGLSNARNRGLALARAPIVAFIDDDAVAAPAWAQALLDAFHSWGRRTGCVGGRVVPRWTAPRPSWLGDPSLDMLSVVDWGGTARNLAPGQWLVGCNIAFRASALRGIGGFSGTLGRIGSSLLSNEEVEAYASLRRRGWRIIYEPQALVEHMIDSSRLTQEWFHRRSRWQAISDVIREARISDRELPEMLERIQRLFRERGEGLETVTFEPDAVQFDSGVRMTYHLSRVAIEERIAPRWSLGRLARRLAWWMKIRIVAFFGNAAARASRNMVTAPVSEATPASDAAPASEASPLPETAPVSETASLHEEYFSHPPHLHSWDGGKTWNTGGFSKRELQALHGLAAAMDRPAIIETGSGNSSIAFLLAGPARLVSIDPDRRILERIAAFCDAKAIDRKCHEVILERSEPALARLAADPANSFDIALIDGGHGWPTVFVDFCFMNAMLRRGGFLILDDTQLHSVAEVASWLREQPQFELAETHPKTLVFRKKSDEHFMPDWGGQPYIVRRSKA